MFCGGGARDFCARCGLGVGRRVRAARSPAPRMYKKKELREPSTRTRARATGYQRAERTMTGREFDGPRTKKKSKFFFSAFIFSCLLLFGKPTNFRKTMAFWVTMREEGGVWG